MYEQTRVGTNGIKERWIPNTGEFLLLKDLRFTAVNALGAPIDFGRVDSRTLEFYIAGAEDRGYIAANDQGHIYNNSIGSTFEVALVDPVSGVYYSLGKLGNAAGGQYEFLVNGSVFYSSGLTSQGYLNKYSTNDFLFLQNRLYIDRNGCVYGIYNGKSGYVIGIRPMSTESAWPGDDLLLKFGIRNRYTGVSTSFTTSVGGKNRVSTLEASAPATDYVAVYDKKMLWRANLYITETGGDSGNNLGTAREIQDWNTVHPWAAPHAAGIAGPSWWNKDCGYNQWNRTYKVQNGYDLPLEWGVPAANLSGGQVVSFDDFSWTPVRSRTQAGKENNFYNNTVAYDYVDGPRNIRAWDSPFDFVYKMHEQRRAIRNHFQQFLTPQSAGGTLTVGQNPDALFPAGLAGNNAGVSINQLNPFTKRVLAHTSTTTASHYQWKFYWKEPSPSGYHAFIPGLGFRVFDTTTNPEANTSILGANPDLGFTDNASAGVDCIGFAQRAASYEGKVYRWTRVGGGIPYDRAEGTDDPDDASRSGRTAQPTVGD